MDLRVPIETLFDEESGNLFVVQVAGNVASSAEVASLEFGTVLGVRAILILGHTHCRAVAAALAGRPISSQNTTHSHEIASGVDRDLRDLASAIEANVRAQLHALLAGSSAIAELVSRDRLVVAAGICDLETGAVRIVA